MSVIGPVLAVHFALSAGELGFLSGTLFVCYCLAQLPVGLALDLYGARRVQFCLGLVSAVGFALFALADGLAGFALARAITGIGIAGGLIGMLKANSSWYDRHRVATMTGLGLIVGTLGSLAVTVPAQRALALVGWRGVFWALAGIAAAVALWNLISVRERTVDPQAPPRRPARRGEGDRQHLWRAALLAVDAGGGGAVDFEFQLCWIVGGAVAARCRPVSAMPRGADVLLCYTLGLMAGGPVTGFATSWAQARGHHPMIVPWLCGGFLAVVQLGLLLQPASVPVIIGLWVLFAFFAAAGPAGVCLGGAAVPGGSDRPGCDSHQCLHLGRGIRLADLRRLVARSLAGHGHGRLAASGLRHRLGLDAGAATRRRRRRGIVAAGALPATPFLSRRHPPGRPAL